MRFIGIGVGVIGLGWVLGVFDIVSVFVLWFWIGVVFGVVLIIFFVCSGVGFLRFLVCLYFINWKKWFWKLKNFWVSKKFYYYN